MAKETILVGSSANDGTGDTFRVAFIRCNNNFTELYDGLSFIAPTLLGGVSNTGGSHATAGYARSPNGVLYIKGLVTGATAGNTLFTLPAGYRPAEIFRYATVGSGVFGWIEVQTGGAVVLGSGSSGTNVALTSPGIKVA